MKPSIIIKINIDLFQSTDWLEIWYSWGAFVRYCVKLPERESDHKLLYNVEKTIGAIKLSFYLSVQGI